MRKILEAMFHRRRFERDLSEELQHHVEMQAAEWERHGLSPVEALRRARIELGAGERYKEECRQARGLQWFDEFRADVLYAWRGLRRNKTFAAVAITTLALGLGANTAVFSLVNAVMLKMLPVEKPEQLRMVYWAAQKQERAFYRSTSGYSFEEGGLRVADMFSYPHFARLRRDVSGSADLMGWSNLARISVQIAGEGQLARATLTSWNYFRGLGVMPLLGRTFLPEDEDAKAPIAVVLNHNYWKRAFGGDPAVVGQKFVVANQPVVVAGVLAAGFHGVDPGQSFDFAMPLTAWDAVAPKPRTADEFVWWIQMMARVPGNAERVRSEIESTLAGYLAAAPVANGAVTPAIRLTEGAQGKHWLRSEFDVPFRLITVTALLILLMTALNVSGLLLARGEARAKEMSARLALGAGRWRLVRQHLTESLVLSMLGCTTGLVLGLTLEGPLAALLNRDGQVSVVDLTPDWRFMLATSGACLLVTLVVGLLPAWRSARADLMTTLRQTQSRPLPLGRALTALQVGLSLVLLVAAAMFLRTVSNLRSLPLGFEVEHRVVFTADATLAGYQGETLLAMYERARARLSALPGVRAAGYSRSAVLQGGFSSTVLYYRDAAGQLKSFNSEGHVHSVSPGYFATMGVRLLAGEEFSSATGEASVAMVNEAFARRLRPEGGSVVGMTLYPDEDGKRPVRIVGVVANAFYDGLGAQKPPTFYMPYAQRGMRQAAFVLAVAGDPRAFVAAVRGAMREVDARVPIYDLRSQEEQLSLAIQRERSLATLLTGFGLLALGLALVGLYGVLSYSVARRTPEIGIRIALGAAPAALRRMILAESLVPVLCGLAGGLIVTWWFSQLFSTLVFGVKPMDAISIGGAVMTLLAGAALAAWLPAYRASRVSPTTALRYE